MKTALLQQEVQEFIEQNLESNVQKLALKKSPFAHLTMAEVLPQIESKQRAKKQTSFVVYYQKHPVSK